MEFRFIYKSVLNPNEANIWYTAGESQVSKNFLCRYEIMQFFLKFSIVWEKGYDLNGAMTKISL
jgi:hypothetical protein